LEITSRITYITPFHVPEDLRDLVIRPAALAALSDDQGRRVDHTVLQPAQEGAFAHGEQSRYGGIGQAISCCKVQNHRQTRIVALNYVGVKGFGDKFESRAIE